MTNTTEKRINELTLDECRKKLCEQAFTQAENDYLWSEIKKLRADLRKVTMNTDN